MRNRKLWRVIAVVALAVLVLSTFAVALGGGFGGQPANNAANTADATPQPSHDPADCSTYEGNDVFLCEDSKDPAFQALYSSYGTKAQNVYCMFLTTKTVNPEAVAAAQALADEAKADTALQAYSSAQAVIDDLQTSANDMKQDVNTPVSADEVSYMETICAAPAAQ